MRPAARLQAAVELLDAVCGGTLPADRVIERYFRDRRYAGSKDRRAVIGLVFAVLRDRAPLAWRLAQATDTSAEAMMERATGRELALAHVALTAPDDLALFGEGGAHAPEPLSEEEKALLPRVTAADLAAALDWIRLGYPAWLDASLRRRFGNDLDKEMAALNARAPLDLRVQQGDRDLLIHELREDGLAGVPTPISPWGIRFAESHALGSIDAYRRGAVEIQDEGSQLVAALALARPGETVIDLCAGAGGKALALASAMEDRGIVLACDIDARRLAELEPRQRRADLRCIRPLLLREGGPELDSWIARADAVLVDAPCTGMGTWRRAPDARWRLTPETLDRSRTLQRETLATAARLVKPGGRLVYAVCSLLPEEGEDQAEAFLSAHPDFMPSPPAARWAAAGLGGAPPDGPWAVLTPAGQGTDGFFIAVFTRSTFPTA
jgi:16S rRNA (cytosine967-C5)-methyltransferase